MRTWRFVQLAFLVALTGSALAVAVPVFVRNLHASHLAEPMDGLVKIAGRAASLAASQPAGRFPPAAALTPALVPRGEVVEDPPDAWSQATWQRLGFGFDRAHRYSFEFQSSGDARGSKFVARAHGDLDGDAVLSTFEIAGESRPGSLPQVSNLEMHQEVE